MATRRSLYSTAIMGNFIVVVQGVSGIGLGGCFTFGAIRDTTVREESGSM